MFDLARRGAAMQPRAAGKAMLRNWHSRPSRVCRDSQLCGDTTDSYRSRQDFRAKQPTEIPVDGDYSILA